MTTHTITQTVGKAAAKTFLQAALAILVLLAVPELASWADDVQNGEQIALEWAFWRNVFTAAAGGGIAALISAAWNWSKSETPAN